MIAQRMKKKLRGKSTIKSVVDGQSLKSRSGLDRWDSFEAAAAVAGQLMMTGSKTLLLYDETGTKY